jgi:hypothetical protein
MFSLLTDSDWTIFETFSDRPIPSYEDNVKLPFHQASLAPSTSSSSSQPDEELPVVTLGISFFPSSPSVAPAVNLNAKSESTMSISWKSHIRWQ